MIVTELEAEVDELQKHNQLLKDEVWELKQQRRELQVELKVHQDGYKTSFTRWRQSEDKLGARVEKFEQQLENLKRDHQQQIDSLKAEHFKELADEHQKLYRAVAKRELLEDKRRRVMASQDVAFICSHCGDPIVRGTDDHTLSITGDGGFFCGDCVNTWLPQTPYETVVDEDGQMTRKRVRRIPLNGDPDGFLSGVMSHKYLRGRDKGGVKDEEYDRLAGPDAPQYVRRAEVNT